MMSAQELPSRYDSKSVETKWYEHWEKSGYFTPKIDPAQKPYVIVIPPPNVTGILHMGHALNNTIQDILIRWKRMQGIPTLWVPGVDHAGIATQNVVEKKLAKEGKTRHSLGRENFLKEVWKWKEEHGSTIVKQLRRLGASCDWTRERFTMDEGLSRAVREAFVTLYERGLIYRGDYIINWCPRCQTALSDEEAVHQEVEGQLYYIKYPVTPHLNPPPAGAGGGEEGGYVTVATTRPETMLGDTAVAINPKDERYQHLRGKKVILPLMNRAIPVIEDDFVDPKFGTGIVKVTPAHDPNDFIMGKRHKLMVVNILNPDATINEHGGKYKGLDRFEARKKIVADLEAQELFVKKENHRHAVGHCYRCHTMVEPYLSKQWFVKMKPLAEKAIQAHAAGKIKFYPDRWTKVYLGWMENIRDWCISRQIWWGHRIPAWYCLQCSPHLKTKLDPPGGILEPNKPIPVAHFEFKERPSDVEPFINKDKPRQCPKGHNDSNLIVQDPDVLDTWFSSWLWPFSTLGWPATKPSAGRPNEISDLEYFYPTSTLITAQEIIFFWVARMIMAGLQFKGEVPFSQIMIHGTVRVEGGQKMSKSLGNIINPLEIIDEMGADALRFSLMMLSATDVYLSRQKFEMGRNFTNKIWNAFRFCAANLNDLDAGAYRDAPLQIQNLSIIDKWILTELEETKSEIRQHLESFRFNEAANAVYHFFWHSFCDWYLELSKPIMSGPDLEKEKTVQDVLVYVLDQSMKLLHPFMPFITEELWSYLKMLTLPPFLPPQVGEDRGGGSNSIMLAPWPVKNSKLVFESEADQVRMFQEAVAGIRDLRSRLGLKSNEKLSGISIVAKSKSAEHALRLFQDDIVFMARLEHFNIATKIEKKPGMVSKVYSHMEIFISGLSEEELKKDAAKTKQKIAELEKLIQGIESRLNNHGFTSKAPEEVIEGEKQRRKDFVKQLAAHKENLSLFQD